jgi:hypothetical protein
MQYVICVKQGMRDEVAIVEVGIEVFGLAGVVFCDGNARSAETREYEDLADLGELDWSVLNTPDAYSREYKRKKSAEVLIPGVVPTRYISRVCVTEECNLVERLNLPVDVDESVFP